MYDNKQQEKKTCLFVFYEPTMMLLIGIWISLTKNPIKPIMAKPIAVAIAIFWNSKLESYINNNEK